MEIEGILKSGISEGFKILFDANVPVEEINLQATNPEFEGSHTFVVFPYLKITKKSPEVSARELGEFLKNKLTEVRDFNAVKGFLNLVIDDSAWFGLFRDEVLSESFGKNAPKGERVMVEYSSPNTNNPLNLGHLRKNFL